jgi:hypothetical protein
MAISGAASARFMAWQCDGVSSGFLFGVGLPLVVVLINIAAYDGTRIKTMWHEVPTY